MLSKLQSQLNYGQLEEFRFDFSGGLSDGRVLSTTPFVMESVSFLLDAVFSTLEPELADRAEIEEPFRTILTIHLADYPAPILEQKALMIRHFASLKRSKPLPWQSAIEVSSWSTSA